MAKTITMQSLANSVEKLATIVKNEFAKNENRFAKMVTKDQFEDGLEQLALIVADGFEKAATKDELNAVTSRVQSLEEGQENIILRLDQMAPNFELKDLKRRVNRIETRLKIS